MSNFSALIATIQANIKTNGQEEITGAILQDVLEAMVQALGTEAINNLETALGQETTNRQNADTALGNSITAIEGKIPSAATSSNKLTDKEYVDTADTALTNAVNAIEDAIENGYVYAGIATPSGTPTTGRIFYLAITAGTYTNYGGLNVTQGINILKYNGTAWAQEQLIALDDTPTPSSSGLVKSGGIYESLNLKNQVRTGLFNLCIPNYIIGNVNLQAGDHIDFNDGEFYVHGTSTSTRSYNFYNNSSSFPNGMKAGKTYTLLCKITKNLNVEVFQYVNGGWEIKAIVNNNSNKANIVLSQNATGLLVRITLAANVTYDDIIYPIITDVDSHTNTELYGMIEKTFPIVEGSTLPTNTDLNNLTITSKFFLAASNTYVHCPIAGESGYLEVERMSTTGLVIQRVTSLISNYYYQRSSIGGGDFSYWNLYKRTAATPVYNLKIAMFGDSITWGRDGASSSPTQVSQTIPIIVEQGGNRFKTTNFGYGSMGWLSTQYRDDTAIDAIMAQDLSGYDVITYMFGANDTNEPMGTYTDTGNTTIMGRIYNAMMYVKNNYPKITQVLIGITNSTFFIHESYGGFPSYDWNLPVYVSNKSKADLDEEMRKFANYYHIPYISLKNSPISSFNLTTLVPDNIHPNQDGYMALGGYIKGQLESILGS